MAIEREAKYAKRRTSNVKSKWRLVAPEIRSIGAIDLALQAENVLEKVLWLSLAIIGVAWAVYFIGLIIIDENPIVTTIEDVQLTEIEKPAITICPQGTTKFAIADRLGNFLSSENQYMPPEILNWYRKMTLCSTRSIQD